MSDTEERLSGGKYFGVCPSFHHSKACNCKRCPSYPGDGYMFCARGNDRPLPEKRNVFAENVMFTSSLVSKEISFAGLM
jgi:hypothetical protein